MCEIPVFIWKLLNRNKVICSVHNLLHSPPPPEVVSASLQMLPVPVLVIEEFVMSLCVCFILGRRRGGAGEASSLVA
jgi:hypothetical protein